MARFILTCLWIASNVVMRGVWADASTAGHDFEIAQSPDESSTPKLVHLKGLLFEIYGTEVQKNDVLPRFRTLRGAKVIDGQTKNKRNLGMGSVKGMEKSIKELNGQGKNGSKKGSPKKAKSLKAAKQATEQAISKKGKKQMMMMMMMMGKMGTRAPTLAPTKSPTAKPTTLPTKKPTAKPTKSPTAKPTKLPTKKPTAKPTTKPVENRALPLPVGGATDGSSTNFLSQGGTAPDGLMCGCIQSVLPHPTNANICYAGAVNGGVWRTMSCTAAVPNWEPLTDGQESLSISDVVYDLSDTSFSTILVGIAARSSFRSYGGPHIGLLYTQNALAPVPVWRNLDNAEGQVNFRRENVQFISVFARGDLMLAAAYATSAIDPCPNIGIFQSKNRGRTWINVLRGTARALASDPNDENRFYATMDRTVQCNGGGNPIGVYTSSDGGDTWTATAPQYQAGSLAENEIPNAKLSVSRDRSRVWSSLIKTVPINPQRSADILFDLSYSDNQGTSWTRMDEIGTRNATGSVTGLIIGQGYIHFSMLTSDTNRNEIYTGGDRQNWETQPNPNEIGATGFTGRFFRGDAGVSATGNIPSPQWEHMTDLIINEGGTASSSGPHADSRDMEVRADGSIIEANDGGVAIRTSPSDNQGDWFSACGTMVVFESHGVAYDPVLRSALYGTQDTGTILFNPNVIFQRTIWGADGNAVMIDSTSDPDPQGNNYYYFGSQHQLLRLAVPRRTGVVNVRDSVELFPPVRLAFLSLYAMNPQDQRTFAVGNQAPGPQIAITRNRGDNFNAITLPGGISTVSAMSWSSDGNILYFSDDGGRFGRCTGTGPMTCQRLGQIPQSCRNLAVNPLNSQDIYAITENVYDARMVFRTTNGGTTWTSAVGTAPNPLSTAARGAAATFVSRGPVNAVVVGTSNGVLVREGNGWRVLDDNIPNVIITQLVYNRDDDLLFVATFGRGIWVLANASAKVANVLGLQGAQSGDGGGSQVFVSSDNATPLAGLALAEDAPTRPTVTVVLSDLGWAVPPIAYSE